MFLTDGLYRLLSFFHSLLFYAMSLHFYVIQTVGKVKGEEIKQKQKNTNRIQKKIGLSHLKEESMNEVTSSNHSTQSRLSIYGCCKKKK